MSKNKEQKPKEKNSTGDSTGTLIYNKKAKFGYELLEFFETGMVLTGSEIKTVRAGQVTLNEAYVRADRGEIFLIGAHFTEYKHNSQSDYNPTRNRKLLMHKKEIIRLQTKVDQKGLTLVPVRIYIKKSKAKLEIAIGRGKNVQDKRKTVQDREQKLQLSRAIKNQNR